MNFLSLFLLAVGLSMDAFAVSICKGLAVHKANIRHGLICGLWFGGFQALMPLMGYFLGNLFSEAISSFDHWIAFGLLALIGMNMLKEAFSNEEECADADFSPKSMLVMAIATSIDALAVGISLSMAGNVNIWQAIALIGVVTCALSTLGVRVGTVFGCRFGKKAQIAGGCILILIGLKILAEHTGVFG